MKSRVFFVLLLLVALFVAIGDKSKKTHNAILRVINPIKQTYKNFTLKVEDRSKSYIFQKESIEKLTRENRVIKRYLLDQTHYLQQVNNLFKQLPSLERLPYKSIALVDTISYVKLNSFNEILLTNPKKNKLIENKVYGLIQKNTIGGTAIVKSGNLYGYLTSNPRCKFSVFVGENKTPGIAEGVDKNTMLIKYIPKWANIKEGDLVETSGLDNIFFANIPVGKVISVKVENSYKTAYISTTSDTLHPKFFFLITDARPRLTSFYDQNSSFAEKNDTQTYNTDDVVAQEEIKSIPTALQTKESEIDLSEFEIPKEEIKIKPIIKKKEPKPTTKKPLKKKDKINTVVSKPKTETAPQPNEPAVTEQPTEKPKEKHRNPLDIFRI